MKIIFELVAGIRSHVHYYPIDTNPKLQITFPVSQLDVTKEDFESTYIEFKFAWKGKIDKETGARVYQFVDVIKL